VRMLEADARQANITSAEHYQERMRHYRDAFAPMVGQEG